jgi:large subunit ribosomal protein L9
MARVELMLRENLRHLGKLGDMVSVSPGYARNFLLPRGLAAPATSENRRVLARKRERQDAEEKAITLSWPPGPQRSEAWFLRRLSDLMRRGTSMAP